MTPSPSPTLLLPGDLLPRVRSQTQHALTCGALQSIPTSYEWVESGGVRFLVRVVANLIRKDADLRQQLAKPGKPVNPFLPYDDNLCVGDLSDSHVCLLNKFNVVDHHLLIITRHFESQDTWLTVADFDALWRCLAEMDGLGFYNAGEPAGASQPHKHLQLIPLPMADEIEACPIAPVLQQALAASSAPIVVADLPFAHGIARLEGLDIRDRPGGSYLCDRYRALAQTLGLLDPSMPLPPQSPPYNLIVTRQWMLMVPRSQSSYQGVPVNSLGFTGALLARDHDQLQRVKDLDPMTILQQVGRSRPLA